jgi:HK97 family phage major capsid protein
MSVESRMILNGGRKEFRDMGITPGSAGGFFVPQGFVYEVEEALKYYGPMLQSSEIMDTATGNPLPYPTDNDTTVAGELVGEGVQVTTADITLGQVVFGAYKFSTKMVKVSIELLQDSAFDMEAFCKKKFAVRLGRILNTYFTTGTGVSAARRELRWSATTTQRPQTPQRRSDTSTSPTWSTRSIRSIALARLL